MLWTGTSLHNQLAMISLRSREVASANQFFAIQLAVYEQGLSGLLNGLVSLVIETA